MLQNIFLLCFTFINGLSNPVNCNIEIMSKLYSLINISFHPSFVISLSLAYNLNLQN